MVEPGPRTSEALQNPDSEYRAEGERADAFGSAVRRHLAIITIITIITIALRRSGIRLVANDRTAQGTGRAADRGSLPRVVMELVADDRAGAGTDRAAGERALFTAA
jgi:hypothetical protein